MLLALDAGRVVDADWLIAGPARRRAAGTVPRPTGRAWVRVRVLRHPLLRALPKGTNGFATDIDIEAYHSLVRRSAGRLCVPQPSGALATSETHATLPPAAREGRPNGVRPGRRSADQT